MTNSTSTSKPRVIVDPQTLSQRRTTRPRTQAQITDIRQTKEYKVAARRWLSTIVALPIFLYTSWVLYDRTSSSVLGFGFSLVREFHLVDGYSAVGTKLFIVVLPISIFISSAVIFFNLLASLLVTSNLALRLILIPLPNYRVRRLNPWPPMPKRPPIHPLPFPKLDLSIFAAYQHFLVPWDPPQKHPSGY
ncbi:hypothetical protein KXV48_002541 [Aspergillus fumigatus]|nr:hypothetical protein KXV48_002541 [Aspergillus fumigatus]